MVDALRPEFNDQIGFVLVDLQTQKGHAWALSHSAGQTTLIFFGASGRRVAVLQGEQSFDRLRSIFRDFAFNGRNS